MANRWDLFKTWQYVLPPSRPDKWQLSIIEDILFNYEQPKVAVLGSTIEFRDLLAEQNISDVYVFENNRKYFSAISRYRKNENAEKIVWGNWLDTLNNYQNQFDLILSDLTSGNIPYEYRDWFYKSISAALTPKGFFIDRVLTKPIPFIPFEFLIDKYEQMEVTHKNVNNFNCEVLFCSSLIERTDCIVDTNIFYDQLLSIDNSRINNFVNLCYLITPRNCIWWYSKDWKVEDIIYEKYLSIQSIYNEPQDSAYINRAKLFVSSKRRSNI